MPEPSPDGGCCGRGSARRSTLCHVTLAPLLDLADIGEALAAARRDVDDAFRHRALRRQGGPVAVEAGLRTARASAALDGHVHDLEDLRAGTALDPAVQGALRVSQALDSLTGTWRTAPRQALARLHVLAGRGVVPDAELGRPVAGQERLDALTALIVGGQEDTVVLAAVVHAELLAVQAFGAVNGVVARGAARLTLISGGLDPRGLLPVDVGHLEREPEYRGAAGAYATGTRDGVRSWLKHYTAALRRAAQEATDICNEVRF